MTDETEPVATDQHDAVATALENANVEPTGRVDLVDPPESLPVDELVPVCGASKQNYVCVRPPDHDEGAEQVVHISMTDSGNIVQWVDGQPGVKIRPMTLTERQALEGQAQAELQAEIAEFVPLIIGKLDISPGDVVIVRAPEDWGIESHRQYNEALVHWSQDNDVNVKWLVMPASTDVAVLHPETILMMADEDA